jgi:hypothetical protein
MTAALYGVSGQRHAPAALYPRGKDPRYPLDRRGWVGPRAGYAMYISIIIFVSVYLMFLFILWSETGSSVSIVSGYGLDDRAIEVRSPAEAGDFSSSLCVQTGSGVHPASCLMGTGGSFPGGYSTAGSWRWPLTPSSAEVENE